MLLLGTFATAQFRAPYTSAQADLIGARDILNTVDRDYPNIREIKGDVDYAINQLNGARTFIGQTGGLPPGATTRRGDRLEMVADLLERARQKLASYRGERNPDARNSASTAQDKIEDALRLVNQTPPAGRAPRDRVPYSDPSRAPYTSAQADLIGARDILNTIDRDFPNIRDVKGDIDYAINQLNGARMFVGQTGGLPPGATTRRGDRLEMVADLLERARQKLASYRSERNPDARNNASTAQDKIEDALRLVNETLSGAPRRR